MQSQCPHDVRFGSEADMCGAARDVRFVPKADMCVYFERSLGRTLSVFLLVRRAFA